MSEEHGTETRTVRVVRMPGHDYRATFYKNHPDKKKKLGRIRGWVQPRENVPVGKNTPLDWGACA